MSDFNSSLPIITETNGDVVAQLVDGTVTTQKLAIDAAGLIGTKLADGAGTAITSQTNGSQTALDVGINVAGVQIDPRAIRALTAGDVVTAAQGAPAGDNTAPWWTRLTDGTNSSVLLSTGELTVSVTQPLPAGTNIIGKVSQDTSPWITSDLADGSVTGGTAGTMSILMGGQYNSSLPTLTTGQQAALQSDSSGRLLVANPAATASALNAVVRLQDGAGTAITSATAGSTRPLDVALRDSAGALYSNANPLPVFVSAASAGTNVNKYNTSVNLAAAASANHDYSVTSTKTFYGRKFWASASGKIRMDVILSPDGSTFTNVVWTGFNSTANPNITVDLNQLECTDTGAGAKVRVVITNQDKQQFDVFSTISGVEQ